MYTIKNNIQPIQSYFIMLSYAGNLKFKGHIVSNDYTVFMRYCLSIIIIN